jgi:PKD repeat protein
MTFIWGDGTSSTTGLISSGSKASASHVYSAPGIYIVQAQAADINGAQSEVSDQVQVIINTPPATPGAPVGPGGGAVGTSYTFTLSSADPDGDRVKHVIDWGDKTATATELFDSGAAVAAMHSWTKAGSYSVKAKAVDEYGAESAWSAKKSVKIA